MSAATPDPAPLHPVSSRPTATEPALLEVAGLGKRYQTGEDDLWVLSDVAFRIRRGEMVAVIGESGTGKSTLLHLVGTLDRPTQGEVRYDGRDVFALNDEELARFRNKSLGFVFQFHHLLPEFTALENVAMPALIAQSPLDATRRRARELLDLVGLGRRVDHRPSQLSGGERQRVAVARALMNGPDLLIADEPTGNLDTRTAEALHDEFVELNRVLGQTYIIATHNPRLAARADRVFMLSEGAVQEIAPETLNA